MVRSSSKSPLKNTRGFTLMTCLTGTHTRVKHLLEDSSRLHYLQRLRVFAVSTNIMIILYESALRFGITSWFKYKAQLSNLVKTAGKVMGQPSPPVLQGHICPVCNWTGQHHHRWSFPCAALLKPGRRYGTPSLCTELLQKLIYPTSYQLN